MSWVKVFTGFSPLNSEQSWKDVTFTEFPDGALNANLPNQVFYKNRRVDLKACIDDAKGLLKLALTVEALRGFWGVKEIYLSLPYLPYARQDRRCNPGESFSLKVVCNFINSLKLDRIEIHDPHSEVSPALLENVFVVDQIDYIRYQAIQELGYDYGLVCPDAGAMKKVEKWSQQTKQPVTWLGVKHRETSTGKITKTQVIQVGPAKDSYLLLDDICDGGRTFIEIGKALREEVGYSKRLNLFITHGIFSKGFAELYEIYDKIITTNSFRQDFPNHPKLKVITVL